MSGSRTNPQPIDLDFYREARALAGTHPIESRRQLSQLDGTFIHLDAGDAVTVVLESGAQVVDLFPLNRDDHRERLTHQTMVSEGLFMTRYSRLWGTMPRCRPLMTILEDSVVARPDGPGDAFHHPLLGGSGTRLEWLLQGGAPGVATTWEQLAAAGRRAGVASHHVGEPVSLFQKAYLVPGPERVVRLASDALAGDHVRLLAEIDLVVLIALSPYVDGAEPDDLPEPEPRPVEVQLQRGVVQPLPWPYPGQPALDLEWWHQQSSHDALPAD